MSFSTQALVNDRVLVSGTDVNQVEGQVVVDATQWNEIKANKNYSQAVEDFDAAVDEFFKPLIEAAEKAENATAKKPEDSVSYVVLSEEVEGVEAKKANLVRLNKDSIVLRLIEEGQTDRLIWVEGSLEILEANTSETVENPMVQDTGF